MASESIPEGAAAERTDDTGLGLRRREAATGRHAGPSRTPGTSQPSLLGPSSPSRTVDRRVPGSVAAVRTETRLLPLWSSLVTSTEGLTSRTYLNQKETVSSGTRHGENSAGRTRGEPAHGRGSPGSGTRGSLTPDRPHPKRQRPRGDGTALENTPSQVPEVRLRHRAVSETLPGDERPDEARGRRV